MEKSRQSTSKSFSYKTTSALTALTLPTLLENCEIAPSRYLTSVDQIHPDRINRLITPKQWEHHGCFKKLMILDCGSRQLAVFGFVLVACLFSTFMASNCIIVSLSGLLKHFLQAYTYVLSHFTLNY